MFPQDPFILLGVVNSRLRDQYDSLDALCEDLDVEADTLHETLSAIGYTYNEQQNQFR